MSDIYVFIRLYNLFKVDIFGVVKLADLGLTTRMKDLTGTICGSPLYMAPEVYKGQLYSEKADMFSFGMIMWELWYGECVIVMYQVNLIQR